MKNFNTSFQKNISRAAFGLAVAAGISLAAGTAFADDPTSMAPPVETSAPAGFSGETNAAADSVFNWREIPANQEVPLTRASFDQGGYQLYDAVGETIVVPFTSENLYVMKFATSPNGNLYFENEGGYPVLYVPRGGFLENATVSGARWYPFGQDFHPTEPVFLGIAPSYDEFINLGWYPDTFFYGGYYGHSSFISGGIFLPTIGLFFSIGGHPYYGWNDYHRYYEGHPGYYRTNYYNRDFYHYAGSHYNQYAPDRHFGGGSFNHGFNNGNASHSQFGGRSSIGGNAGANNGRSFRGSYNGGHNYIANRSYTVNNYGGGGRSFGGNSVGGGQSGSGRTFRGASNYSGGQSYTGGSRSYGGGQSYSGNQGSSLGGGRENFSRQNYSSQTSGGGRQSYGGGNRGSFSGGSRGGGGSQSTRSSGNQGGGNRGGGDGGRGR